LDCWLLSGNHLVTIHAFLYGWDSGNGRPQGIRMAEQTLHLRLEVNLVAIGDGLLWCGHSPGTGEQDASSQEDQN
jgi:hypothetical protein